MDSHNWVVVDDVQLPAVADFLVSGGPHSRWARVQSEVRNSQGKWVLLAEGVVGSCWSVGWGLCVRAENLKVFENGKLNVCTNVVTPHIPIRRKIGFAEPPSLFGGHFSGIPSLVQ